jgi:folate-dependent phosphoribosylglycinamide formyltransferase PurN
MSSAKKIILLGRADKQTAILYHSLASEFLITGVVVENGESRLEFVKRRVKRLGWQKTMGQVAFRLLLMPYLRATSRGRVREIIRESGLDASPIPKNKLIKVRSVNADETIKALQDLKPDVIIVSGTRIISARVLSSTTAVFINMHAGITPMYRGAHGGYWALVQKDRDACGVTVHEVDAGIDTGRILGQVRIAPNGRDNFATYGFLQIASGLTLLKKAVCEACEGQLQPAPAPTGKSHLWTHPTLAEYVYHRVRSGVK